MRWRVAVQLKRGVMVCLLVMLVVGSSGCALKFGSMTTYTPTRTYQVTGTVRWQGKPGASLWVRAEAVPASPGFSGGMGRTDVLQATETYSLDLPLEVQVTDSGGAGKPPTVRKISGKTRLYRVRVEAPPGWQVTPKEYRVTKPTTNLDFTLRPTAGKRP